MECDEQRSGRRCGVNTAAFWIFLGVLGVILLIVILVLVSLFYCVMTDYRAVSSLNSHQQKSDEKETLAFMAMMLQEFMNLTQKIKEQNMEGFCSSLGWIEVNRKCYYASPKGISKNWTVSKRDCECRGGRLATVKSRSKLELLTLLHYKAWIGLSDRDAEGTWVWEDGTGLETSGFWLEGEPNDADGKENCAHLDMVLTKTGFNDNDCESLFPYICETVE